MMNWGQICVLIYHIAGADLGGGGHQARAPLFLLVTKIFTALYLPLCQYLLKNQLMYRSKLSTVCVCNCLNSICQYYTQSYPPSARSLCFLARSGPHIRKFWIHPCIAQKFVHNSSQFIKVKICINNKR